MRNNSKICIDFINPRPYDVASFNERVEQCCSWLEHDIGLNLRGRVPEYIKKASKFERLRGYLNDEMYYTLQSYHELNQIIMLHESLNAQKSKQFITTLKKSVKGISFRDQPNRSHEDQARNHMFELTTASDYANSDQDLDLTRRADIIIDESKLLIECKRVKTLSAVNDRLIEAAEQIESDETGYNGLIYIDITEIFEELHTIYCLNETGPLPHLKGISNDEETKLFIEEKLNENINPYVNNKIISNFPTLSDKILGIVLIYNFVGFHISMFHERVITGRMKRFVKLSKNIPTPEIVSSFF
ncbi:MULTISPECIES: hypothetical protein [Pseudomonas]|uniref:Uncharacterized protein n=2 Tax=Pseudomonas TaxID=286 RepID=A0A7Y1A7H2_PSEVE|nr:MULTISPECIES: hypothetical protein [Pseudomonas]NMY10622.1 hypothetical protein [Pseudomonas veronii]